MAKAPMFTTANDAPKSMANILAAHIDALRQSPATEHMADWPFSRMIASALETDMWRCRNDGPYPSDPKRRAEIAERHRQYDADFFLALGEAVMMLEIDKMYAVRVSIFRSDVTVMYEVLTRGVKLSPSSKLMYLLRGAFNEHRFGRAF